jgi:uncharacterized protein (TIGR02246 family)
MGTDAVRRLIDDLLETYNAPDLDRAASLYAEDCRYTNRAYGIDIEGRAAQRANMQAFLDRFPDRRLRPVRVVADGRAPPWRRASWPRASEGRACRRRASPTQ